MHAYDNPLIRNPELDRVVAGGRDAIVDYFLDWSPQAIGRKPDKAFRRALNALEEEWLGEALGRASSAIKDAAKAMPRATREEQRQAMLEAWEDAEALFRTRLYEKRDDIISEAQSTIRSRVDTVEIRVFRDRIEITDLLQKNRIDNPSTYDPL